LNAEGAFAAAQVEELYQIDRWGDDPHAKKQREGVQTDIEACTTFLALLGNRKLRG
jgi:chaperone required for assembly of F1-ATPase